MTAPTPPLATALATWALELEDADVPDEAVRRHLTDALGCALAAARTGAAEPVLAVAAAEGEGPSRIPGTDLRVPPAAAALAIGTLIHALDFDDTHAGGLVHASAPVVATALAVGQAHDCGGAHVRRAVAAGLEVICRLAAAAPHGFHRRGFHATSVCGAPAAALVAAMLSGADATTAAHAIGIAVSTAAGSLEFLADGATTKQLHPGLAARAGITAAQLAAAGATGPAASLEGRHGLFQLYTGSGVDPAQVLDGLGERWECEAITIKPYPACQLVHATLDAVAALEGGPIAEAEAIIAVEAAIHPDAVDVVCEPVAAKRRPRTPYDAKFSLQWTVAAMIIDGHVGVDTFAPASLQRDDLAALADRVTHQVEPAPVPAAAAPGHVRVELAGGEILIGRVSASRGGPGTPLGDDALSAKLTGNVGDAEIGAALRAAVDALAGARDLGALMEASCPPAAPTCVPDRCPPRDERSDR